MHGSGCWNKKYLRALRLFSVEMDVKRKREKNRNKQDRQIFKVNLDFSVILENQIVCMGGHNFEISNKKN